MLTQEQAAVVARVPANTVVYASPGSGKTTILTHHIAQVLMKSDIRPQHVMAMTFTRQAATNLKRRLAQISGLSQKTVEATQTGTFHAQIFRMLLRAHPDIPVLLSPLQQQRLLTQAIRRAGLGNRELYQWESILTREKSVWPNRPRNRVVRNVMKHYEHLKTKQKRWDFDDILLRFCDLYCSSDRLQLPAEIHYLLVDEFQDTNAVQMEVVRYFAKNLKVPVFVVGDDDQAIYGFRGASPHWLLDFKLFFPDTEEFQLSVNFRSDQDIMKHAGALIKYNQNRSAKDFVVASPNLGFCMAFLHKDEEAEALRMLEILGKSHETTSTAILARTRKQLLRAWELIHNLYPLVQFRTFHDAKGKEWNHVHLIGCVDGNPYLPPSDIWHDFEEERRLMYVAMTRARTTLYIHVPLTIQGQKYSPSRYIEEAQCATLLNDNKIHRKTSWWN